MRRTATLILTATGRSSNARGPSPTERLGLVVRVVEPAGPAGPRCQAWTARERLVEHPERVDEQVLGHDQGRQEAQDVAVGAGGEHQDALGVAGLGDGGGHVGGRVERAGLDELDGDHGAAAADVADERVAGGHLAAARAA